MESEREKNTLSRRVCASIWRDKRRSNSGVHWHLAKLSYFNGNAVCSFMSRDGIVSRLHFILSESLCAGNAIWNTYLHLIWKSHLLAMRACASYLTIAYSNRSIFVARWHFVAGKQGFCTNIAQYEWQRHSRNAFEHFVLCVKRIKGDIKLSHLPAFCATDTRGLWLMRWW